jgi:hypothetical protein
MDRMIARTLSRSLDAIVDAHGLIPESLSQARFPKSLSASTVLWAVPAQWLIDSLGDIPIEASFTAQLLGRQTSSCSNLKPIRPTVLRLRNCCRILTARSGG